MSHYKQIQKLENFNSLTEISTSSKPINLKLVFSNDVVISPVFTKQNIICSGGNKIEVMLFDVNSTERVTTGPVAFVRVKIVLLDEKYDGTTTEDDEFEKNIVINCGKKKNLLQGDIYVNLKYGTGTVGEIRIKHDSKPIKNVVFRLGAMVVDCSYEVKQAITQPFIVKDLRNVPKPLRSLSLKDGDNMELDRDCYSPYPCENDVLGMIVDPFFSIEDFEELDRCFQGSLPCQASLEDECGATTMIRHGREGMSVKAKKRWVKMRTFLFSIASFVCV